MSGNLYVRPRKIMRLMAVTADDNRNEEATVLALRPQEAVELGKALIKHGTEMGGTNEPV